MSRREERFTATVDVNGEAAKKELELLKREAEAWRRKMVEASEAGDTKGFKKAEQELRKVNAQMRVLQKDSIEVDRILKNLSTAGPKELRRTLTALTKELNSGKIARGSKEWDTLQASIQKVRAEIQKVNAEGKQSQSIFSRIGSGFNKYLGVIASGIAAMTGLTLTARKCVNQFAEMEEAEAQVRKYTGMTTEEVKGLNEELKKMDTRTARTRLNELASDAGRLGITEKTAILEFVDAADKINVALGKDLGQDAVKNIGKLALMFGENEKMGLRGAMLATGSAVNELAQNSSAAEPYLVDFTARVAGAANQAKMSQADIMGYASVLDQNMQKQEMAATAFQTLLMKMYQAPAKFAKLAGKDVKEFTRLIKEDSNEAMLTFISTLNQKGGLDKLAPMFKEMGLDGVRASGVISTMAGKINDIRIAQKLANEAYEEGVSVINEFNVQNTTVQGELDKRKKVFKELSIRLGEDLLPVMKYTITSGSALVKMLSTIIEFLKEYGLQMLYVISVIGLYIGAQKVAVLWETRFKNAQLLSIATAKLKAYWDKIVAASTWLYIAATSALTGKTVTARIAMEAFFKILKLHPFAAILTVVLSLAGAFYLLTRRTDAVTKAQERLNDIANEAKANIAGEITYIERLVRIAKDEQASKDARYNAIKRLNEISPKYLGNLTLEKINTDEAKSSIDAYIESLIKKATLEAKLARLAEINTNMAKYGNDPLKYLDKEIGAIQLLWNGFTSGSAIPQWEEWVAEKEALEDDIQKSMEKSMTSTATRTLEQVNAALQSAEAHLEKLKNLADYEKAWLDYDYDDMIRDVSAGVEALRKEKKALMGEPDKPVGGLSDDEKKKLIKKYEDEASVAKTHYTSLYAIGKISKVEYDAFIEQADRELLKKKMTLYSKETSEYNNLRTSLLQMDIRHQEKCTQETLDEIDRRTKEERRLLTQQYADEEISKEAHEEGLFRIEYESMKRKRDLYAEDSKEYKDLQEQLDDMVAKDQLKRREEYEKKLKEFQRKYRKESLNELKGQELDALDFLLRNKLIKHEDYEKYKLAIQKKYAALAIKGNRDISGDDEEGTAGDESGSFLSKLFKSETDQRKNKLDNLKTLREQELITDQDYFQRKAEINAEYYDGIAKKAELVYSQIHAITQSYSQFNQASQELEEAKIKKKYDAEIKAAGRNSTRVAKLEEQKEKELAKVKSKYADKAFKIQIAQGIAQTALSAINAYSSAAAVPLIGYILAPIAAKMAIAAGMIQMAAVYRQHQASKMGYYKGGFTPLGRWDEEQGVVHSEEFVANRFAVRNKNIRPVLNLLDRAQKNNTVGSLTAADVTKALNGEGSVSSSGSGVELMGNPGSDTAMTQLYFMIMRNTEVMNRLSNRLDEPFTTVNTVDGEHGIKQAWDKYNSIQRNKSRHD